MPTDFSKYSDEQLQSIASSMGGGVQPSSNPSITVAPNRIEPAPGDVTFSGIGGVDSQSGIVARGIADNQVKSDLQRQLIPLEVQAEVEKQKAKNEQEKQALQRGLRTFLAYDRMIPRGHDFISNTLEGMDSMLQGWNQSGQRGIAVKMHNDMIEGLKTPMAKALGNMGNLAQQEQQAAKQLFTRLSDSQEVTEGKQAFLIQIATGIENNDPAMVKDVIRNFMGSKLYDAEKDKQDHSSVDVNKYFTRKSSVGNFKI